MDDWDRWCCGGILGRDLVELLREQVDDAVDAGKSRVSYCSHLTEKTAPRNSRRLEPRLFGIDKEANATVLRFRTDPSEPLVEAAEDRMVLL